jgi:hypothetical protein
VIHDHPDQPERHDRPRDDADATLDTMLARREKHPFVSAARRSRVRR